MATSVVRICALAMKAPFRPFRPSKRAEEGSQCDTTRTSAQMVHADEWMSHGEVSIRVVCDVFTPFGVCAPGSGPSVRSASGSCI